MAAAVLAAAVTLTPATTTHHAIERAAHIPVAQQAFAECVAHRESRGSYTARGDRSSARGRYQFLDLQWRRGLSYMVAERLRHFGMPAKDAKRIRVQLASRSIDRWAPAYQDAAFVAVLNADGAWSGWRHWHLSGSKCNRLVPAGAR